MSAPKREALRRLLSDGRWHGQQEMLQAGGLRYTGRVEELRKGVGGPALDIESQQVAGSQWRYRARIPLSADAGSPPPVSAAPPQLEGASFQGGRRFREESPRSVVIETPRVSPAGLVECECKGWRRADVWPHSPRWSGKRVVDCMGREVTHAS